MTLFEELASIGGKTWSSSDKEQHDSLLEEDLQDVKEKRGNYFVYLTILTFLASLAINFHLLFTRNGHLDLNKVCSVFTSEYYSPIQNDVNIVYETVQFNGSFLKRSPFRGDAGLEVDEAWEALGTDYRPIIVSEDEATKYGLSPGHVKRQKDQGGGFFANVEVLHHLHCLNLLRKSSYFSHNYYSSEGKGAFANEDKVVRLHFSHCLDILRQQIMCTADVGIFGQRWIADPPGPFVDFNTKHKCKNFDAIRVWALENQVVEANKDRVEFREGDVILPDIP